MNQIFNHCAVAIFRLTDLTEAINEKVKIGCTGIAFTYAYRQQQQQHSVSSQCSCPQAYMKEKPVQPFNNLGKFFFFMIKAFTKISSSFV